MYRGSIHQTGPTLPPSLQFARAMSPQGEGGGICTELLAPARLVTNPTPDRQNHQLQGGLHLISCRTIYHHTSLLVFKQYEIISKNFAFRSREVSPTAQHHFDIRRKKIFIDDDNFSKLCVVVILPSINIDEFQNPCFFLYLKKMASSRYTLPVSVIPMSHKSP